jgi:hypothetical protein
MKLGRGLRLTTSSSLGPLFRKFGIFDVSQTYRPLRPTRLRALHLVLLVFTEIIRTLLFCELAHSSKSIIVWDMTSCGLSEVLEQQCVIFQETGPIKRICAKYIVF